MEEKHTIRDNPWRGLSSYMEGEVLYGRDDDIRDLSQCVLRDQYTLLYGKSGIGKSSILNAAIIPALRRHGYVPVALRLSHGDTGYLAQIHAAIAGALGASGIRESFPLKGSEETLYEYLHRHSFWNKDGSRAKIFLLFDQFEEIFTLQSDAARKNEFFRQLADQCNGIRPDSIAMTEEQEQPAAPTDDMGFELPDLDGIESEEDNDVRMIFSIREDFLSEFDYHVSHIPVLRSNRYYLRPINEEQAAQIIMKPRPDLVSKEDAWLIISKVTKRTDFKIDGQPELMVDAAVLSLYLSKLYDARKDDGPITADLIETRGGEILYNFYMDAISAVSPEAAAYLEDNLLTGQGRRDNITEYDALEGGHVTKEELLLLIREKKILRRFNYAGEMRIEYIHDTLCPVVRQHIEERQAQARKEEEDKKMAALKKRNRFLLALVTLILLCGTVVAALWLSRSDTAPMREGPKIPIQLVEDESVSAAKLFWRADLLVLGETSQGAVTLLNREVNDKMKDSNLMLTLDSVKTVRVKMSFGNELFVDIDTTFPAKSLYESPLIRLVISKKRPKVFEYGSKVLTYIGVDEVPLQNAVVVIRDKVMLTGADGSFSIQLEEPIKDNDLIYIVKEGFGTVGRKAKGLLNDGQFAPSFHLEMDDGLLAGFEDQCSQIDSLIQADPTIKRWEYWLDQFRRGQGFRFIPTDSTKSEDRLVMVARSIDDGSTPGRRLVTGVYYFRSEYRRYKESGHPHYAYHIFTGYLDRKDEADPGKERHFEFESLDFVNTRQYLSGVFSTTVNEAKGNVSNTTGIIGTFGE